MIPAFDGCECTIFPSKDQRDWRKFMEKPKFNPATLQPFDRVMVRDSKWRHWHCEFFSHIEKDNKFRYSCGCFNWGHCIPYNEDTKHLVGTKYMEPEFYQVDEYE